jgi:hypothetical protein
MSIIPQRHDYFGFPAHFIKSLPFVTKHVNIHLSSSEIFTNSRRFTVKYRIVFLIVPLTLALSACSGSAGPKIEIQDPWVRAAAMMDTQDHDDAEGKGEGSEMGEHMGGGGNSAAYMILKNTGNEADRMLSADSDIAEAVELHISEMKDGVMTMHQVDGIDIPGNGQAELKPGGLHVMLIGLKQELKVGDIVNFTLNFEKSGTITTEADVRMP